MLVSIVYGLMDIGQTKKSGKRKSIVKSGLRNTSALTFQDFIKSTSDNQIH